MITPYNLLRHELTGLRLKAEAEGHVVEGIVDAETAKTFKIRTPEGVKTVRKESSTLDFTLPNAAVVRVEGRLLSQRPADRVKQKHRIRF